MIFAKFKKSSSGAEYVKNAEVGKAKNPENPGWRALAREKKGSKGEKYHRNKGKKFNKKLVKLLKKILRVTFKKWKDYFRGVEIGKHHTSGGGGGGRCKIFRWNFKFFFKKKI